MNKSKIVLIVIAGLAVAALGVIVSYYALQTVWLAVWVVAQTWVARGAANLIAEIDLRRLVGFELGLAVAWAVFMVLTGPAQRRIRIAGTVVTFAALAAGIIRAITGWLQVSVWPVLLNMPLVFADWPDQKVRMARITVAVPAMLVMLITVTAFRRLHRLGAWSWKPSLPAPVRAFTRPDPGSVRAAGGKAADVVLCVDQKSGTPVVLRERERHMHLMVAGPTGAGKTTSMLMSMAVQDVLNPRVGGFVMEPGGDWILGSGGAPGLYQILREAGRDVWLLDPIHPDSAYYNPLMMSDIEEAVAVNRSLFRILAGRQEAFFERNQAIVLMYGIRLLRYTAGDGEEPDLEDLGYLLQADRRVKERVEKLEADLRSTGLIDNSRDPRVKTLDWFRTQYFGPNHDEILLWSIGLRQLLDELLGLAPLARMITRREGVGRLDLERALAGGWVLINTSEGHLAQHRRPFGVMMLMALNYSLARRLGHGARSQGPVAVYVDEFGDYVFPDFVGFVSRARRMGGMLTFAFQSFGQVLAAEGAAGVQGRALRSVLVGQLRNKVVFGGWDEPDDLRYLEELLGSAEVEEVTEGEQYLQGSVSPLPDSARTSVSRRKVEKALVPAREIQALPENHVYYRIMDGRQIVAPRVGIASIPDLNKVMDRARILRGTAGPASSQDGAVLAVPASEADQRPEDTEAAAAKPATDTVVEAASTTAGVDRDKVSAPASKTPPAQSKAQTKTQTQTQTQANSISSVPQKPRQQAREVQKASKAYEMFSADNDGIGNDVDAERRRRRTGRLLDDDVAGENWEDY